MIVCLKLSESRIASAQRAASVAFFFIKIRRPLTQLLEVWTKNKNIELRVKFLAQEFKEFNQQTLATSLEIAGLPEIPAGDVKKV